MSAAGVDVDALNRDCTVDVRASTPEGPRGKHFVPDYWIAWQRFRTNIAFLEYFEPENSIRSLHVYDSKYLLRKPVVITNLLELLSDTNFPANPFTPDKL